MLLDEVPDSGGVVLVEWLKVDELVVAALREPVMLVEDVCDPTAHPGCEVATGAAEHNHPPAGHVLAAVIADSFDHGVGARVPDREPLAGEAAEEGFALGG